MRTKEKQTGMKKACLAAAGLAIFAAATVMAVIAARSIGNNTTAPVDLLILVNKEMPLPEDFEVELQMLSNGEKSVAKVMYEPLKKMMNDGSEEGLDFVIASAYRDSEYQKRLLDEDIELAMKEQGLTWQEAYDQETRETMPPGYSEHETGLAVDIVALDYQYLDEKQGLTKESIWLRENCSRYGFILRYPEGKEEVTGIDYESWHFRYVGVEAAQEIMEQGITLEEYLESEQQNESA